LPTHKPFHGLDFGKFILSVFVVAAHTSPLKSISITPNFILIQILARNVVPLYFMISGYLFYIKRGSKTIKVGRFTVNEYYYKYIKRMLAIYLVWSAVYLFDVLDRYYYGSGFSLPVFALAYLWWATVYGTYLQLWFFPALLFAISLVQVLGRKIGLKRLLLIASFFYVIGLFGDAYYGVIQDIPSIASVYKMFFFLFNTTRNGLMYGLLFVTMGAMISEKKTLLEPKKAGLYALISLGFLAIEAFSLRTFSRPIDYNVMIFIIPTSYFNFQFLL
jgi:serine/alanine racemase